MGESRVHFDRELAASTFPYVSVVPLSLRRTLTAHMSARRAMSTPRAAAHCAASDAAARSSAGAGCHSGGPLCVSSPIDRQDALMTPSPRSSSAGNKSNKLVSFKQ